MNRLAHLEVAAIIIEAKGILGFIGVPPPPRPLPPGEGEFGNGPLPEL